MYAPASARTPAIGTASLEQRKRPGNGIRLMVTSVVFAATPSQTVPPR
jgi:hypothetical protein